MHCAHGIELLWGGYNFELVLTDSACKSLCDVNEI